MDGDGVRRVGGDHRQHLLEAEGLRAGQQFGQHQPPQAAAGLVGVEIDRILAGEAIGGAGAVEAGIGIAHDLASPFGDDQRMPELLEARIFFRNRFLARRLGIEGDGGILDIVAVDRRDGGNIGPGKGAEKTVGHGRRSKQKGPQPF